MLFTCSPVYQCFLRAWDFFWKQVTYGTPALRGPLSPSTDKVKMGAASHHQLEGPPLTVNWLGRNGAASYRQLKGPPLTINWRGRLSPSTDKVKLGAASHHQLEGPPLTVNWRGRLSPSTWGGRLPPSNYFVNRAASLWNQLNKDVRWNIICAA